MADRAEAMAAKLCELLSVEPFRVIHENPDRKFAGYEGDYFMNWAREQIEVALAIEAAADAVGDRPAIPPAPREPEP